jgi:hypothetical protein
MPFFAKRTKLIGKRRRHHKPVIVFTRAAAPSAPPAAARDRSVLLRSRPGRSVYRAHCRRHAGVLMPGPGPAAPGARGRASLRRARRPTAPCLGIPWRAETCGPRRQPRRPDIGFPSCSRRGHATSRTRATWGVAAGLASPDEVAAAAREMAAALT